MGFKGITYSGGQVDDPGLLDDLPSELRLAIGETNGLIAFRGGFHMRGACVTPAWHSLREAWRGAESFTARYPEVRPSDIPFAEDALGDQFLLREGYVLRLATETGEVEALDQTLHEFIDEICRDPVGSLGLEPLLLFESQGGHLEPGQLLSAYPPFCTEQSAHGVSLRAVPVADRLGFLATLSSQISGVSDGTR